MCHTVPVSSTEEECAYECRGEPTSWDILLHTAAADTGVKTGRAGRGRESEGMPRIKTLPVQLQNKSKPPSRASQRGPAPPPPTVLSKSTVNM